ncbi:galactose oxidase-like domain-containing protein [Arthrobacter sp. SAFR-014]|uniref:galactose oxidase-like domain-containing protein n=1 Tax=unclassified Arthrobacter TaxID=235627 RepID=UPI003F7C56E2
MHRLGSAVTVALLLITGYVAVAPHRSPSATGSHAIGGHATGPHIHIAALPAAALEAAPPSLPRSGWMVTASDEQVSGGNGRAAHVLDGDAATYWQSGGTETAAALPRSITIDTGAVQTISGFRYLPRADSPDGRVGSFEITVSTDGALWAPPVARGTWADTSAEKSVTFAAVQARYVRLQAMTEAGGRGPWSSAAEINLLGESAGNAAAPPAAAPPVAGMPVAVRPVAVKAPLASESVQSDESLGSWDPTINFPLVPTAAALLPGNRLLTWSAYSATTFGGAPGFTQTSILDLATGAVSQSEVSNTGHDMFCPGTSLLPDGQLMVTGGSNSTKTSLYNPATDTWTAGPAMKIARGYHSSVTTSAGEVFTIGGSWSGGIGNKHGEVWSAASGWRTLPNVLVNSILTADPLGSYRADNHPWLFAAPGGRVFHAGPSRRMNWITTAGSGSISPAGPRSDSADAMSGDAVMYDIGKILTVGGAPVQENSIATARAYTIDINAGVTVARTADMAVTRSFANGVALPDGQVLVVGGQGNPVPFTDTDARMAPEIWNPATGQWTTLAPMAIPRTYHSVALLLPDGRVFVGGGGLCGSCTTNHLDGEIFTPPYLLNADGSPRARPKIVTAPTTATTGSTISVTTAAPVTEFSLMRMGSATHTVNTDQRRIPLNATGISGNTASLKLPADTGVLVPGNYLLFALDAAGVPSVAATIAIGAPASVLASRPTIGSDADTLAVASDGVLWNYHPNGTGGLQPRERIGAGWSGLSKGFVTDWNTDGVFDIMAQWKDGRMIFYPGKPNGGFAPPQVLSAGWSTYHVTIGRWRSTDKYPGILAYDAAGTLWYYGNSAGKGLSPRVRTGTGWRGLYLTMADYDQDGKQDVIAKRGDGNLMLYRSNGAGSFIPETRRRLGGGWNTINSITEVTGFRPGVHGLITRLTDGRLAHYPFSKGIMGTRTIISAGWGSYNIFR